MGLDNFERPPGHAEKDDRFLTAFMCSFTTPEPRLTDDAFSLQDSLFRKQLPTESSYEDVDSDHETAATQYELLRKRVTVQIRSNSRGF